MRDYNRRVHLMPTSVVLCMGWGVQVSVGPGGWASWRVGVNAAGHAWQETRGLASWLVS